MQAVILAAGRGSRLEPVTDYLPKPLIPFWGRPFLSYLLENLEGLADEVFIVDNPEGEIREAFGERYGSLPLRHVIQHNPRGTGDAVLQTRGRMDGSFVVMLADTCPPRETIREVMETEADAIITCIRVDDPQNHAGVRMDDGQRVQALWTDAETVDAGMFRVPERVYDLLEEAEPRRGEVRISQGVHAMMEAGEDVRGVMMPHPWLQFGDHEGLDGVLRVMRAIRDRRPGIPQGLDSSVDVTVEERCEIHNSLVFGPGELIDCTITDSMVYCGRRLEGARIEGEMTAFGPE